MSIGNRRMVERVGLLTLVVIFLVCAFLSSILLRGVRIDLTENRLYTLSDGTINILESIPEPINLYFFFSDRATADIPALRNYAIRVQEMLEELEQHSNGNLNISVIDPLPFSEDEDRAAELGLQAVNLGLATDAVYFGIAGTNAIGDEETIAFLDPNKDTLLEYDLARLVYSLANPKKPIVGLLSGLPMDGGLDQMTQQLQQPWVVVSQIRQLFDLRAVGTSVEAIDPEIDVLIVVHPKQLSLGTQYAIDQFILNGGRSLFFVDPFAEIDLPAQDPSNPAAAMMASRASNLPKLFGAWGISVPPADVVGDDKFALVVSAPGQAQLRHIGYLGIDSSGLDDSDVITTDLDSINIGYTGHIVVEERDDIEVTPLIQSSEIAATLPAARIAFITDPNSLRDGFEPSGEAFVLAARISGIVETAFPDGPPDLPTTDENSSTTSDQLLVSADPINVIIVADVDILTDRFWAQVQNFFGQRITTAFAGNGSFVTNALDNLTGSGDLIGMRGRESYTRPFTRVQDLRREAEKEYRLTEQQLQQQLSETEAKLAELQANREESTLLTLSEDQEAEIDRFVQERSRIRKELRQVQRNLDQDIENLGTALKFINIALIPLLMIIAGLGLLLVRRNKPA